MKTRLAALAAALATALPLAQAQDAVSQPSQATPPNAPAGLVIEPAATASRTEGPRADIAKTIVDAINADPVMKHSKITVLPEEDALYLVGVTLTYAQTLRASEIAKAHGGGDKVANAIQTSEIVILAPPPQDAGEELAATEAEQPEQQQQESQARS